MPSTLDTLSHFWKLSQSSGNRLNAMGAGADSFIPGGTITKVTGIMSGSDMADLVGGTHANHLAIPSKINTDLTGPWFDQDFTFGLFFQYTTTLPTTGFMLGRGQWYGSFDFSSWTSNGGISLPLGDGTAASPFGTTPSNPYGNGTLVPGRWYWVCYKHEVAAKRITVFLGNATNQEALQVSYLTYTGTIGRSPLPFRLTGANTDAIFAHAPCAVQGAFHANSALSGQDILALYGRGRGIEPPFSDYQTGASVPFATSNNVIAHNLYAYSVFATSYTTTHSSDTSLTPDLSVKDSTIGLEFGWPNIVHEYSASESNLSNHASITISASYFIEGVDTVATPLTFDGLPSTTIPYGEVVYCDQIDRVFFKNHKIRVLTYYSAAGGINAIPGVMQFTGTSGRRGTGTNTIADITISNYTTEAGLVACFGPSILKGSVVGPNEYSYEIGIRGDSTSATIATWPQLLAKNGNFGFYPMGVSATSSETVSAPANDLGATFITKSMTIIMDMLGINDLNSGTRTFAQFKASKSTCWARWCGAGSSVTKMIVTTLTPMGQALGSPALVTQRQQSRGDWNTFIRAGATNQDFGDMTGRPTLAYRWDGSNWVSQGGRSTGTGANLDIFVLDIASVSENDHIANDNVWSTSTAGGTKADCTETNNGDKIHPTTNDNIAIAGLMQARFSSAMTFAPDIIAPTITGAAAGSTGRYIDLTPSEPLALGSVVASDFTLTYGAGNTALLVSSVALNGGNIRLTLASTPATPLYANDTNVLLDFAGGVGKITDIAGNSLAAFTDTAVVVTAAPAAPVVVPPATINAAGDELTIPYDSNVFRAPTVAMAGYTLTLQNPLPSSSLIYTISPLVSSTATPILTVDGGAVAVTNNSTVDGVPPVVTAIAVASTGLHLDVTCSESMALTSTSGADFTLTYGVGNTVVAVSSVALLTASIIRLTLAAPIYASDTNVLLDFVGGANKIEDTAGNDLAAFTNSAVSLASAPAAPLAVPPATINAAGNVLTVPFDSTVYRTPTVAMPGYTLTLTTVLPAGTLAYSIAPPVEQGASPGLTVNGASVAVTNGSTVPPSVAPPVNLTLRMEVSGTLIIRITGE